VAEGDEQRLCPRCGTPAADRQEYCLECGQRLDASDGLVGRLGAAWRARFGWYPGDWIWPILLALVVAVLGGIGAVAAGSGNGGRGKPLVATHPGAPREPVTPPETATVALPTVPRGTPTTSGPPPTPSAPPQAQSSPSASALATWPANRAGYTVVVESVPTSAGRSIAVARARSAKRAGLPQVGVLDSSRYSSLHPGYWVVFSGIYGTSADADAARQSAAEKGFTAAYSRQITR
jgi:hypothetical protein